MFKGINIHASLSGVHDHENLFMITIKFGTYKEILKEYHKFNLP